MRLVSEDVRSRVIRRHLTETYREHLSLRLAKTAAPLSRLGARLGQRLARLQPSDHAVVPPERSRERAEQLWRFLQRNALRRGRSPVIGAGSRCLYAAAAARRGYEVVAVRAQRRRPDDGSAPGPTEHPIRSDRFVVAISERRSRILLRGRRAPHTAPGRPSTCKLLSAISPVVVFTAAPPGQGGTGHINEQAKKNISVRQVSGMPECTSTPLSPSESLSHSRRRGSLPGGSLRT